MPQGIAKKAAQKPNTVQTLQASMSISGPRGQKSGAGTARQTVQESLKVGNAGKGRRGPKIGRNHVRDAMGL